MSTAMLERLPVADYISQRWAANKTAGVVPNEHGTTVEQLVFHYGNYQPLGHDGIDFGCPEWTEVYAPAPGRVDYAGWSENMPDSIADKYGFVRRTPTGGIVTLVDHGNGLLSAFLHGAQTGVSTGQWVVTGQRLFYSGNTGRSGGPHLHWSVIILAMVYVTPLYGRVNPLLRIPTVTTIPVAPGGTGDAATGPRYLLGLNGITIPR